MWCCLSKYPKTKTEAMMTVRSTCETEVMMHLRCRDEVVTITHTMYAHIHAHTCHNVHMYACRHNTPMHDRNGWRYSSQMYACMYVHLYIYLSNCCLSSTHWSIVRLRNVSHWESGHLSLATPPVSNWTWANRHTEQRYIYHLSERTGTISMHSTYFPSIIW